MRLTRLWLDYTLVTGVIAMGLVLALPALVAMLGGTAVSERPVPSRQLWWLAAGFTVWCSALVVLYAIQGIGCAFAWPTGTLRLWLAVALLVHLIVLGWMWRDIARAGPDFGFRSDRRVSALGRRRDAHYGACRHCHHPRPAAVAHGMHMIGPAGTP